MGQPYVGEIRMFAGTYAPLGWAFCDGTIIPISENTALFQLLGTIYGGDGQTNFALPNLQGRVPLHCGIVPSTMVTYTLGDATQQTLREIWTGPAYREFRNALLSKKPPDACANCGLRWSL